MRRARRCLVVLSLVVAVPRLAAAAPGQLDPSFGVNGIATIESGSWGSRFVTKGATRSLDPANADAVVLVAVAPVVGLASYGAAISSTGTLIGASDLGLPGQVTDFGVFERILGDPTDASHRIYAVGYRYVASSTPPYSFLVGRLSPLGDSHDPAWGGGAPVVTAISGATQAIASALAVQADGKLLVAGSANVGFVDVALARYDTTGALDPSFGTGGTTVIPGGSVQALALQDDGKIILAGFFIDGTAGGFGLVRLLPDGTLDQSFGAGFGAPGVAVNYFRSTYTTGIAVGVHVSSDGRIVAAGSDWDPFGDRGAFVAARYLEDGTLDPTFGRRGKVRKRVGKSCAAGAIAFLGDGKILIAGGTRRRHPEHHTDIALLRLAENGRYDRSFGRGGKVQTPVVPDSEGFRVRDVVVDSLGRTTVVGVSADGSGKATILARYLP